MRNPVEPAEDPQGDVRGGYSAQRLIGNDVRDLEGQRIGRVHDVLVQVAKCGRLSLTPDPTVCPDGMRIRGTASAPRCALRPFDYGTLGIAPPR